MLNPLGVVQIPADGLGDALLVGRLGIPAQLLANLVRGDAVAAIVARAVGDVADEVLGDGLVARGLAHLLDDGAHDVDVGALVVATHVVHLAQTAARKHHVDGLAVVVHI